MFKIVFSKQAKKKLVKTPKKLALSIRKKIDEIARAPFKKNANIEKLRGVEAYRLRMGDWRILYQVKEKEITVIVVKIATRGEVYKK